MVNAEQQAVLLPLWDLNDFIAGCFEELEVEQQKRVGVYQVLFYILEELCVALSDRAATSPVEMAVEYLRRVGVEENKARQMCFEILHNTLNVVSAYFPTMTWLELSKAKFVAIDARTLRVTLPPVEPHEYFNVTPSRTGATG